MKVLLKISFITQAIILLISIQSFGQCDLSNLVITNTDCNSSEMVDIVVDFDYADEGNQGFTILGNGVNYGNFMYSSLPVTLPGILGNCDTEYEFIVRDIFDPTCSIFTEYGTICCVESCDIEIIAITPSSCTDDQFSLTIDMTPNSIGNLIDVSLNGTIITQVEITNSPLVLDNLTSNEAGQNQITICSATDLICCSSMEFLNPCECTATNITTEIVECSNVDSSYYVIVDFDYVATSDSFQMGGDNNFLGNFAYADLPVLAGPIEWSDDEAEILIADQNEFLCFSIAYLGVINDCDINCQIFNVFAESYDCENGIYYMELEFDSEDIQSSTFDVIVDGVNYGSFLYGENSYTVGPINQNCDSAPVLIIRDSENNQCSDFFNFDEPICCSSPCEFTTFEASAVCNDAEEVIVNFVYSNPNTNENSQFFVTFNGAEYGPYSGPEGDGSFTITALSDGEYTLIISVEGDSECNAETIVIVDCPAIECLISEPFAEAYECEGEGFLVDVTFESFGVSDSFELRGNGQSYGIFSYGEPFYTVGPLQGDCETIYEFIIIDQGDEACNAAYGFQEPVCCQSCELGDLNIALIDCQEDLFTITIDFTFEDTGESFTLNYIGEDQTYAYSELPIEINNLPLATDITFTVTSTSDSLCGSTENYYLETCLDNVSDINLEELIITQDLSNLIVDNSSEIDMEVIFISISGEVINRTMLTGETKTQISKANLSNGIYLLSFINNGNVNTKKVFILD